MPAGQGPNGRLPAASAAAWAPRPGPRPGPRACVVRACVRACRRAAGAWPSARACPAGPSPVRVRARRSLRSVCLRSPRCRMVLGPAPGWRRPLFGGRGEAAGWARGTPARARCRWEAGVGAGLSLWYSWGAPGAARSLGRVGIPGFREQGSLWGTREGCLEIQVSGPFTGWPGPGAACLLRAAPPPSLGTVGSGLSNRQTGDAAFVSFPHPNWREGCPWPEKGGRDPPTPSETESVGGWKPSLRPSTTCCLPFPSLFFFFFPLDWWKMLLFLSQA